MSTQNDQSAEEGCSPFFGKVVGIYEVPSSIGIFEIRTIARSYKVSKQDHGVKKIQEGKKCLIIFECDAHGFCTIRALFRRAPIPLLVAIKQLQEREMLSHTIIKAFRPTYFLPSSP